jgi:hypothetical protein
MGKCNMSATKRNSYDLSSPSSQIVTAPSFPSPPQASLAVDTPKSHHAHFVMKNHKKAQKERRRAEKRIMLFDFNDVTVTELKDVLRLLGKCSTGKKSDLLERVRTEHERIKRERAQGKEEEDEVETFTPIAKQSPNMNATDLKSDSFSTAFATGAMTYPGDTAVAQVRIQTRARSNSHPARLNHTLDASYVDTFHSTPSSLNSFSMSTEVHHSFF